MDYLDDYFKRSCHIIGGSDVDHGLCLLCIQCLEVYTNSILLVYMHKLHTYIKIYVRVGSFLKFTIHALFYINFGIIIIVTLIVSLPFSLTLVPYSYTYVHFVS